MDIVYHYPHDLFESLVNTIPLLCKYKKSVVSFFRGAGVETDICRDLEKKIAAPGDGVNKYEMVRSVLSRLNERGEMTLRERREIIRRVVEFEDFSTCWPDDVIKAKGLISEIRRMVDVKDSFTRMRLEKDREIKKYQLDRENQINDLKKKRQLLEEIKRDLYSLFAFPDSQAQKRGKLLEGVMNRLFDADDILVREAFEVVSDEGNGVLEQIDGVVEIDGYLYLVEIKWWREPLGKAEVSPHLVKVFNRGHAGGIIISKAGYTVPAIDTCKDALVQKSIVLCDLEEIVALLEKQGSVKQFFKEKLQRAIIDKKPYAKKV
ncbi:MAG: restriction endonuclease [Chlorobiaceae bacterium]|nr:restriction endonuclease [Chlorobiaceae bacterium]